MEQRAASAEELVALLRAASARRETASTGANAQSSRSHAVYQLSLRNGGRLLLVDLAGNEGSIETLYHSKAQMAEAAEINASLMALKTCLHARATAAPHVPSRNSTTMAMGRMHILTGYHHLLAAYQVPFRDSTLTRVLQDALTDAKATTAVLACLSPACSHLELSVRTMGVSVTLMGRDEQARQEAETLHEVGVRRGGPATWTADELRAWLAERPFAARVALPDGATGASLMKLPVVRLQQGACGGDKEAAQALFDALRAAARTARSTRPLNPAPSARGSACTELGQCAWWALGAPRHRPHPHPHPPTHAHAHTYKSHADALYGIPRPLTLLHVTLQAKEAAAKELQLRKDMLEAKSRASSRGFAKNAPAKPVAQVFGATAANVD